jgi:hypothetical protein
MACRIGVLNAMIYFTINPAILKTALDKTDAIIIGAGPFCIARKSGLPCTTTGLRYDGEASAGVSATVFGMGNLF